VFSYAIGVAWFLALWLIVFAVFSKCRKPMLAVSLAFGHFGPMIEHWYLKDYWRPVYAGAISIGGILVAFEDYFFAFAFSGLAAASFQMISSLRGHKTVVLKMGSTIVLLQLVGVCWLLAFIILNAVPSLDSVDATVLASLLLVVPLLMRRRADVVTAAICALSMGCLIWTFYESFFLVLYPDILDQWWIESALTGITIVHVPVEEVAWACAVGLFVGPILREAGAAHLPSIRQIWELCSAVLRPEPDVIQNIKPDA
jgi:hypothetical protein